ncbi:hypothetical protein PMAYCL1PPCAC_05864, partial [Pristionchus mayeri]
DFQKHFSWYQSGYVGYVFPLETDVESIKILTHATQAKDLVFRTTQLMSDFVDNLIVQNF